MILERLEKYKEALDVVRGKLGGNLFFNKLELCGEYSSPPSFLICPLLQKKNLGSLTSFKLSINSGGLCSLVLPALFMIFKHYSGLSFTVVNWDHALRCKTEKSSISAF